MRAEDFLELGRYVPEIKVAALQVIAINRVAAALEKLSECNNCKPESTNFITLDHPGLTAHKCKCQCK